MSQRVTAEQPVDDMPKVPVVGRYTVELTNADTGAVRKYETPNYVTELHYDQARVLQVQAAVGSHFPTDSGSASLASTTLVGGKYANDNFAAPRGSVAQHIICTDWSTAEDTTESWGKGNVIAFAPKVKVTALSTGMKGLVNETESNVSDDLRTWTWVWDWSTTQGNGEFQSILMGSIGVYNDGLSALKCGVGEHGRYLITEDGVQSDSQGCQMMSDNTTVYAVAVTATVPYVRWLDVTTAFDGGTGSIDDASGNWRQINAAKDTPYSDAAWIEPGTTFMTGTTSTSSSTYYGGPAWDCDHDGTNVYFVHVPNTTDALYVRAFNLGTGTALYNNTSTGYTPAEWGASYSQHMVSCTVLGTKLYVIYTDQNVTVDDSDRQRIARFDATDGSFEAFIDLSSVLRTNEVLLGIRNDGTDLIVDTNGGVKKFTTGGAYVANSNIGTYRVHYQWTPGVPGGESTSPIGLWQETGVAPDSVGLQHMLGPYRITAGGAFTNRRGPSVKFESLYSNTSISDRYLVANQPTWLNNAFTSLSGTQFVSALTNTQFRLLWHNSKLWCIDRQLAFNSRVDAWDSGGVLCFSLDGDNMFSRARLDSPVAKSSSETMKITYQLTMPADPFKKGTHVNPWA